jgi:hypothetical protein
MAEISVDSAMDDPAVEVLYIGEQKVFIQF